MPYKPSKEFVDIARKKLNPVDTVRAVINSSEELRAAVAESGIYEVVEVPDFDTQADQDPFMKRLDKQQR